MTARRAMPASGDLLLAFDTATMHAVVALGSSDGRLVDSETWDVAHRHAEELLGRIDDLLARNALARADLAEAAAFAVGTGPGAFTGLRVGIATAKALARAFDRPLIGVPSGAALLRAASNHGPNAVLLLPAGPADVHLVAADGRATYISGGTPAAAAAIPDGAVVVAVDLAGRAEPAALARGEQARAGFAAALVSMAAERLAAGATDDPVLLVPEYVTLPRGLREPVEAEVAWTPARP